MVQRTFTSLRRSWGKKVVEIDESGGVSVRNHCSWNTVLNAGERKTSDCASQEGGGDALLRPPCRRCSVISGRIPSVIKGASAVDPEGNAGVLVSHPEGGTIGWAIGCMWARGIQLITPVGLEKLVPSVRQSVSLCGQYTFDYVQGKTVGMIPLTGAKVVTEITALKILAGVEAFHVASGGVNGSEGSVTLVAEGKQRVMNKAIKLVESIKGEPGINFRKGICESVSTRRRHNRRIMIRLPIRNSAGFRG